jgi:hypothetical protein
VGFTKNKKYRAALVVLLSLEILFLVYLLVPHSKIVPLANGEARVEKASYFRAWRPEASCKIWYTPKTGGPGLIELWQDTCDGPILLINSTNANVLLCLYDYDVDMRVFRIDTSKTFKPLPPKSTIKYMLFTSTWEINYASVSEWGEVQDYLQNASGWDYTKHRIRAAVPLAPRKNILESLKHQNLIQQ